MEETRTILLPSHEKKEKGKTKTENIYKMGSNI